MSSASCGSTVLTRPPAPSARSRLIPDAAHTTYVFMDRNCNVFWLGACCNALLRRVPCCNWVGTRSPAIETSKTSHVAAGPVGGRAGPAEGEFGEPCSSTAPTAGAERPPASSASGLRDDPVDDAQPLEVEGADAPAQTISGAWSRVAVHDRTPPPGAGGEPGVLGGDHPVSGQREGALPFPAEHQGTAYAPDRHELAEGSRRARRSRPRGERGAPGVDRRSPAAGRLEASRIPRWASCSASGPIGARASARGGPGPRKTHLASGRTAQQRQEQARVVLGRCRWSDVRRRRTWSSRRTRGGPARRDW